MTKWKSNKKKRVNKNTKTKKKLLAVCCSFAFVENGKGKRILNLFFFGNFELVGISNCTIASHLEDGKIRLKSKYVKLALMMRNFKWRVMKAKQNRNVALKRIFKKKLLMSFRDKKRKALKPIYSNWLSNEHDLHEWLFFSFRMFQMCFFVYK